MAETLISPGVLTRENDISFIQPQAAAVGAAFIGPTVKGPVEQPTVVTSYGQYQRLFGTTIQSGSNSYEYLTSIAVKSYFEQGGNTALVTRVVSGSYSAAENTTVLTVGGSVTNPFKLETLGKGTIYNNATGSAHGTAAHNADGSIALGKADNIRFEITNVNDDNGTFSLLVRRGDDSRKNKIILETFNDLSLDPNSENYIERVIGNQSVSKTVEGSEVFVTATGEYANKSNYIRVASVNNPTLNYLANDGVTVNNSYNNILPVAQSGSFYNATGTAFPTGKVAKFFKNISNTDTQGLVATNYADAISILSNKDEYQFNIVTAPGLIYDFGTHKTQLDSIISLVEGRGDAIAVVDLEQYGATVSNVTAAAGTVNSSYAAAYWPWLQTQSSTGKNEWVPASTVIPGVYAFTDSAAAPWFAPAGLVKGGIPNVIQAERKVSREQRDLLYRSNVNPIATFPGQGIAVYGQKTLQKKASALDRVNVRRLLIELKRFIGGQANNLVFEQNTIATRNKFLAIVNPYLESVVQRQGLYAYRVVMDDSNNTADIVDRNQIVGQIFIQPAKTAEFVVLDFTIEPTGATFVA
jgi:phage tail sheath protein FI